MADQVVFFRVEAQGVGDLVDQLGLLRKQASELQKEMRKAADPAEYTKLNRELEINRMAQKEVRSEVQKVQKAQKEQAQFASTSYRALNSELVALRRSYKELTSGSGRRNLANKQSFASNSLTKNCVKWMRQWANFSVTSATTLAATVASRHLAV